MWGLLGGPVALWGGLRSGPQMPTGLHMASDATTLCPKLMSGWVPYLSLSLSLWPPDQCSRPWDGPQTLPRLI